MHSYENTFSFKDRAKLYHKANTEYPGARKQEFQAVIRRLKIQTGWRVADMPAGGGYMTKYIEDRGAIPICVEPTKEFAAYIPNGVEKHVSPIHEVDIPDGSVNGVMSLAGLHHVSNRMPAIHEMMRILRNKGRFVIADVEAGTPPAFFLNEFVAEHNPDGHDGMFFGDSELGELVERAEPFADIRSEYKLFNWTFKDTIDRAMFVRKLFGLHGLTNDEINAGLRSYGLCCCGGPNISWGLQMVWGKK